MVLDRILALEELLRTMHHRLSTVENLVVPPAKTQTMPPAPPPHPLVQPSYDHGDD